MEHIHQALKGIGMNEKEITIYLALLQTGSAPGSAVAQRTGIPRSTVHFIGRELVKKGILLMTKKNNVYSFAAEPPEKLLYLLEREQKKIQQQELGLQKIMGPLKGMMNPLSSLPKVQYYEGKEGMITLYNSILELRQPIDSFEDKGEMHQFIPEYVREFIKKRVERGIFNRVICPSDNRVNIHTQKELREVRTLKTSEFPFTCDIKICGAQVSIFSFQNETAVGVSLVHQEIADNFRMLFGVLWALLGVVEK